MKVYLSKNKQANPTDIAEARAYFMEQHEVVEFQGGEYSESILDDVEILCIVPPGQHKIEEVNYNDVDFLQIPIGKGNFTELLAYRNRIVEDPEVYVFKDNTIYSVHKAIVTEVNWANSWANLLLKK